MPYVVVGLLILVALGSGGIGFSANTAQSESGRVLVSGGEAAPAENINSAVEQAVDTNIFTEEPKSETPIFDFRTPSVTTYSPQNIDSNSATARARVDTYSKAGKQVYIVYGYDERRVRSVASQYKSFSDIPVFTDDRVRVYSVDNYISSVESYSNYLNSLVGDTTYFYTYCLDYEGGHVCGTVRSFDTVERNYRSGYFYQPSIYISRVSNIEAYSAVISGSYNMNDGRDGTIFLVYGTSKNLIDAVSNDENYSDVDEDGESIKTSRLATKAIGSGEFYYEVDDLDRDTEYFYRVCADYESDDEEGMVCTYTYTFATDRRDKSSKPVSYVAPVVVGGKIATFTGSVEMNDFNDGHVFFVYGTSESYVKNVENAGSFSYIYQYNDSLQKISLDTNVDGDEEFIKIVRDLLSQSTYYYRLCTEYEDENDYGYTYLYLNCSDVSTFTTGN